MGMGVKKILPSLRAALRIAGLLMFALPLAAAQICIAAPLFRDYDTIPRLLHRGVMKIVNLRVTFNGAVASGKPTVFAANHMSYLDVTVLGSRLRGSFISKAEVRKWPLIGALARESGVIFTQRRIGTLRRDQEEIVRALNSGRDIILFPEAGTGNGDDVRPFKAGHLSVAFNNVSRTPLEKEAQVQPVSIRVTHVGGREVRQEPSLRYNYTWHGGNLLKHCWNVARIPEMRLDVTFHPPCDPADFPDRKAFVRAVESAVRSACDRPG